MKKLIAALFAAILSTAGLVAFTSTPATAACPYTQCVATGTKVNAPAVVRKGRSAVIAVKVSAKSGNAKPVGRVKITIKKRGGGFSQTFTKTVRGPAVRISSRKLQKVGVYLVTAAYTPKAGSLFKASRGFDTFRVKRR